MWILISYLHNVCAPLMEVCLVLVEKYFWGLAAKTNPFHLLTLSLPLFRSLFIYIYVLLSLSCFEARSTSGFPSMPGTWELISICIHLWILQKDYTKLIKICTIYVREGSKKKRRRTRRRRWLRHHQQQHRLWHQHRQQMPLRRLWHQR